MSYKGETRTTEVNIVEKLTNTKNNLNAKTYLS